MCLAYNNYAYSASRLLIFFVRMTGTVENVNLSLLYNITLISYDNDQRAVFLLLYFAIFRIRHVILTAVTNNYT